jgi:hypothetical protein
MESTDAAIRILEKIQATIAETNHGLEAFRGDVNARFAEVREVLVQHGQRLDRLEHHAVASNESLGVISHRLSFFERAATVAVEGRERLDDRVDRLEREVDRLRRRDD